MGQNDQKIIISEIKSDENNIRFMKNQRKIGLCAGLTGLLSFFVGFASFIYFLELNYFYLILFIFGFLKSIIYFSKYFFTKTKLSINNELYNLDKESYLIEQKLHYQETYNYYQKILFGYGIGILLIIISLVFLSLPLNGQNALFGILIHGIIAVVIYYFELLNAKSAFSNNFA